MTKEQISLFFQRYVYVHTVSTKNSTCLSKKKSIITTTKKNKQHRAPGWLAHVSFDVGVLSLNSTLMLEITLKIKIKNKLM